MAVHGPDASPPPKRARTCAREDARLTRPQPPLLPPPTVAREAAAAAASDRWERACEAAVAAWAAAFASWQEMVDAWSARQATLAAVRHGGASAETSEEVDAAWGAFLDDLSAHYGHMTTTATAPDERWRCHAEALAAGQCPDFGRQALARLGRLTAPGNSTRSTDVDDEGQ